MSKRSTVNPRWLDTMLHQWGIRSLRGESGLGFPRICVMLKDGIPTTATVYDPNEITPADYRMLQQSIETLDRKYQLVLIRAYRPWRAKEMELELARYDVAERTWVRWLHTAAEHLCAAMDRQAKVGYADIA